MDHQSKYIKVEFKPHAMRRWYLEKDLEDLSSDEESYYSSSDEEETPWPALKKFFKPRGWILEGNRKELEKELEDSLGGCFWYFDNFINRSINVGHARYMG